MLIPPVDITRSIASVTEVQPSVNTSGAAASEDTGISFKDTIKKAVGEVNHLQNEADKMAVQLASGDIEDVHKAMIAMQKAKLALNFTIQVRNKVIDAYQEIMRMQV